MLDIYLSKAQNIIESSEKFARFVLGKYINEDGNKLKISRNQYGKPYLVEYTNIHFNISHSKGAIACAVSDRPVGVDIERIRKIDFRIVRYFFSQQEKDYIFADSESTDLRFTEVWTKKEAYLKFLGTGILLPIERFDLFEKLNNKSIQICTELKHDYLISVCNIRNYKFDGIAMIDANIS